MRERDPTSGRLDKIAQHEEDFRQDFDREAENGKLSIEMRNEARNIAVSVLNFLLYQSRSNSQIFMLKDIE